MMQLILYINLFIIGILFMNMNHPMAMGLMLLFQTVMMCFLTGIMAKTFWFSYVLFLIFLGGMLVLFIYTTSLASNEMFSLSIKLLMFSLSFIMIFIMTSLIIDKTFIMNFSMNNEMTQINNLISYLPENSISLNKLYNFPSNLTTILLINYLLITLIAIVKITNLYYGPIRSTN